MEFFLKTEWWEERVYKMSKEYNRLVELGTEKTEERKKLMKRILKMGESGELPG